MRGPHDSADSNGLGLNARFILIVHCSIRSNCFGDVLGLCLHPDKHTVM